MSTTHVSSDQMNQTDQIHQTDRIHPSPRTDRIHAAHQVDGLVTDARTPSSLGTILSIWAHPDDETYLAGGLMALARDRGQRVVCASASAGERGAADPETWPPARLGTVRRLEAAASMAVIGVHEHRVSTFPDGELSEHEATGRAWAGRLLDEVRPDTILTFGPDGITYHPDHVAIHRWVTDAWQERGRRAWLLYATPTVEHLERFRDRYEEWGMYMSDERPAGTTADRIAVHLELRGPALDRKLAALRAMATQTGDLIDRIGLDTYAEQVAEEAFVAAAPPAGRS